MASPNEREYQLAPDLKISRVINGMWQVAGAHGYIDPNSAIESMMNYHHAGFTTWDLADIYEPAENFVGDFRRKLLKEKGKQALEDVKALTKFVPNPGIMTRPVVEQSINHSLSRMDLKTLDLLQFHWWDYNDANYLKALEHLSELRDEGKIKHVGLTNFDTERMQVMLDHGLKLVSNQVQYSLIDLRPEVKMEKFCKQHGIGLLAYGTLCGGLLSEKYLGKLEPLRGNLDTASLQKYKNMIDAWGGWNLFQELLMILDEIAKKHRVSIANVATRYILDKPQVAGVIIGVRLGITEHITDNSRVFDTKLDDEDSDKIKTIICKARDLFASIGDCGDEYRH
jgi:aryl-alcohol dehydrogenase-like predicted oxidoreductase